MKSSNWRFQPGSRSCTRWMKRANQLTIGIYDRYRPTKTATLIGRRRLLSGSDFSRLVAARTATASASALGAVFLPGLERVAAAAARYRVGVIDAEAPAHQAVDKINRRAADIHNARRVDKQP